MTTPEDITKRAQALRNKEPAFEKRAPSGSGMAMRVAIELIAAVVVGSMLGYWIDDWLGTMPLFLICCMLFGTVAGLVTVKRVNEAFAKQLEDAEKED